MDCTAAKSYLLDELYGELDVDTSVELATHLAGCEACSAELHALQGFRAELQIPAVEIPTDLTERIMARVDAAVAKNAATPALALVSSNRNAPQPWMRTLAPVISKAGAWAMRPQTAMAAVFVLMVGSSAWLLGRGHAVMNDEPAAQLEQGAPLAAPAASADGEFDPEAARAAHGLVGASRAAAAPMMAPGAAPPPAPLTPTGDFASEGKTKLALDDQPAMEPADKRAKDESRRDGTEEKKLAESESDSRSPNDNEAPAKGSSQQASGFSGAMQHYRAQRWDEATAGFEALARQGDANAELWAARSVREGHGCRTALTRFDHLAGTAIGTPPGNDATLEGGICYRNLGQIDSSTQRFQRLLAYDGWSAKARTEIETNHRILVARREAQGNPSGGAGAAAAKAAKPAPAAPAAGPTPQQ